MMEAGSQVTIASGAAWGLSSAGELIAMSTSKEAEEDLKTILLVDDNPGVREVAAELLRGAGYRVIEAESAESALAAAQPLAPPFQRRGRRWKSFMSPVTRTSMLRKWSNRSALDSCRSRSRPRRFFWQSAGY